MILRTHGGADLSARPFVIHDYVRWSDVDPMGIIRWDAYTRFYGLAEAEMFRALGAAHGVLASRFGISLPRRALHMEFTSAPVLDERLEIRAYVSHVGTTSLRLEFDIYGDGSALRSTGYLILVCVPEGARELAKRPWPEEFVRLLEPYRLSVEDARR